MERITADQLNAFVVSSVDVLEKLVHLPTRVGSLRCQPWTIPLDTLVILICLQGDLNGRVVFQFDRPVLRQLLTSLSGGGMPALTDPLCVDALGEVSNVFAGNATGRLESLGLKVTITPPQVLTGKQASALMAGKNGIITPLNSAWGEIGILCLFGAGLGGDCGRSEEDLNRR